jgi:hypothetical protein
LIYHTIHQPMSSQVAMLKDALNAGSDALKKYKISKWLSDDRKNDQLPQEVMEWGVADWQPRTINAGWKYWADVVPQDLAAAGTLMPIINNLHQLGLRMMVFTEVEEAIAWLDELEDSSA